VNVHAEPTTTTPLIDYDAFILSAQRQIEYGKAFGFDAIVEQAERQLAYCLERKERSKS
jgi:hypothetical protein